ncbi:MAG: hypothetical protein SGJ19_25800 [Planctomycetia bacterium]|nr:hypothetical protein [Planctomycetia bacterium]
MRFLRDQLTLLLFFVLAGISAAAAVQAVRTGLPVAVVDHHDEFVRTLTLGPVVDLPAEYQNQMLRQLERELRRGVDWEADYKQMQRKQKRILVENLVSLAERWLDEKMTEYAELPDPYQREHYLEGEIRSLKNMQGLQNGVFAAKSDAPGGLAKAFSTSAARRFEQAGMLRKGQLMGFAAAARERWASQGMQDILPPTGPAAD